MEKDYQTSNSTQKVGKVSTKTKDAYKKALEDTSAKTLTGFAAELAKDLGVKAPKVSYTGHREVKTKFSKKYGKELTKVKWAITEGDKVVVYKYQPDTKREVKATEAVKGLVYEMLKAFDVQVLKMAKSMRTGGYYARFADLEKKLS